MTYASVADITAKGITASPTDIQAALDVADNLIDNFCRRSFGLSPTGTAKMFGGRSHESIYFQHDYLAELEDLKVDGVSILPGLTFINHGSFLETQGYVFPFGNGNVTVVGKWGDYPAVMPVVKKAAIELTLDQLDPKRKQEASMVEKQVGDTRVRMAVAKFSGIANRYMTTGNNEIDDMLRPLRKVKIGIGSPNGPRMPSFSEVSNYLSNQSPRGRE